MGNTEPLPISLSPLEKQHRHALTLPVPAKPPSKTAFFYHHPLPDIDIDLPEVET